MAGPSVPQGGNYGWRSRCARASHGDVRVAPSRIPPRMLSRVKHLAILTALCLLPTGCCTVCELADRTMHREPVRYWWKSDARRSLETYHAWANALGAKRPRIAPVTSAAPNTKADSKTVSSTTYSPAERANRLRYRHAASGTWISAGRAAASSLTSGSPAIGTERRSPARAATASSPRYGRR